MTAAFRGTKEVSRDVLASNFSQTPRAVFPAWCLFGERGRAIVLVQLPWRISAAVGLSLDYQFNGDPTATRPVAAFR